MATKRKGPGKNPRGNNRGQTSYPKPRWRFRELLEALGSNDEISERLVMRGYPMVPPSSIWGWRSRNSIPVIWLPVALQMGREAKFYKNIEELRVL